MAYAAGVDVGSTQTKAVIVDKGREPIFDKVKGNIPSLKHKILLGGDKGDPKAFEGIVEKASEQFTPAEMKGIIAKLP